MLYNLIKMFDDEHGVNSDGYTVAVEIIGTFFGCYAQAYFQNVIKVTKERYYIEKGTAAEITREILQNTKIFGRGS